jgi:hypothetical protein
MSNLTTMVEMSCHGSLSLSYTQLKFLEVNYHHFGLRNQPFKGITATVSGSVLDKESFFLCFKRIADGPAINLNAVSQNITNYAFINVNFDVMSF